MATDHLEDDLDAYLDIAVPAEPDPDDPDHDIVLPAPVLGHPAFKKSGVEFYGHAASCRSRASSAIRCSRACS